MDIKTCQLIMGKKSGVCYIPAGMPSYICEFVTNATNKCQASPNVGCCCECFIKNKQSERCTSPSDSILFRYAVLMNKKAEKRNVKEL
jgi:hypothetical protein